MELVTADVWPKIVSLVQQEDAQRGRAEAKKLVEFMVHYRLSHTVLRTRRRSMWKQYVLKAQPRLSSPDQVFGRNRAAASVLYRSLNAEDKAELMRRTQEPWPTMNSGKVQQHKEMKKFRNKMEKNVSFGSIPYIDMYTDGKPV